MANRPKGFGMTAELARKKAAKFDAGLANEAFEWMGEVLRHASIGGDVVGRIKEVNDEREVQTVLKDGVILFHLARLRQEDQHRKHGVQADGEHRQLPRIL